MAPKKKSNKKADDDWEAEVLGETTEPDVPATTIDGGLGGADQIEDDNSGGGGALLAAIKKNRQNKKKKGKATDDIAPANEGPASTDTKSGQADDGRLLDEKIAEDADVDDVFTAKDSKHAAANGINAKKSHAPPVNDADEESGAGLKSKKEKEKERKEKEKQRKKEQAAKKKTTPAPAPVAAPVEKEKPAEKIEPEAASALDAGKGGKKRSAALALLQKQQERLRQQREAQAQADAEEQARIAEQEQLAIEEEKRKEDARQRRKEREKEKKEALRKEGKLLTPAQKEQRRREDLKKQQMIDAGVRIAGIEEEPAEKKKPVYDSKKRKPAKKADNSQQEAEQKAMEAEALRKTEEDRIRQEEVEKAQAEAEKAASIDDHSDSDGLDDWEKMAADTDEEVQGAQKPQVLKSTKHKEAPKPGPLNVDNLQSMMDAQVKPTAIRDEDVTGTANARAIAQKKAELASRRKQEHEKALAAQSRDNLRSPICCILGHVDTGKTKLLDKVRQTNVQEGEAGGITQQIGATYFPVDALEAKTEVVNQDGKFEFKVPGLLVIDTPGHESFTNLRSRGSSLCNIAILVVDIMHGLEPQTLESMRLLRDRKTPFIVALNKIDRLYGWKKIDNNGFQDSIARQNKGVQNEFRDRLEKTKVAFAEQGFNAELYSENRSMARNVSLVPTSAHTGEGVPDLLKLLVSLTQERMTNQLMYLSEVECTVLEVKVIEGLGTTIDVVLSNGVLREGDRIVLCGINGAISTNIRALLTPAPLKELRLKSQYVHNQECKASLGVKIAANDLEHAIAGSRLLVVRHPDEEEDLEDEVMSDIANLLSRVSKTGRGVSVQASTLGSLEALLEFLKVSKIPVANISIGPVFKRDVMFAGIMLEKAPEYAVMLCFDVKVDKEAQAYADDQGIKIFTADIIYHLFDDFTKHMAILAEKKKEDSKFLAVFPCAIQPIAVFMKKDPILVGADVIEGTLKLHTPLAAVKTNSITGVKEIISLGRVTSIEREHKTIPNAKKGSPPVAVKIEGPNQPLYGRHLEEKDTLYSLISRQSIDTLKEFYRSDVSNEEWLLIKKLKPMFDVP